MSIKFDVIVIGSGPGGEGAAMKAIKEGKKVAICDSSFSIGGSCTHKGTIPSKALRHASQIISDTESLKDSNYQSILKSTEKIITQQYNLRKSFYERNRVEILDGRAHFIDEHSIHVINDSGTKKKYSADYFVIATGSRPYHPEDIDFTHPRILDSDSILSINDNPRTISIYGAGVVGCEYASIFRGLMIKVNLINTRSQLLTFLDDEIIDALAYHLRENGVLIRHNEEYEKVVPDDEGVTVYFKSNKKIRSEYLLWAQGRTGNSDSMGLENIGIKGNIRGSIEVNENFQTKIHPHIYA
ncbi:MAG: FAD-dependent oxidoreductase, partial [Ignavibacteriae bacterium]|nr:FAD-dependent oxidoreductase [Ignavibacteriota bacterium]